MIGSVGSGRVGVPAGAWTAPRTWVPGETVTATLLNTHLRDNLIALRDSTPLGVIKMSADQSIPNGGALLSMNTTVYDTDTMADNANSRLVVKTAGVYVIVPSVAWVDNSNFWRGTLLRLNGGTVGVGRYEPGQGAGFSGGVVQVVHWIRLAVNDNLAVYANQNTGAAVSVFGSTGNSQLTYLAALRVAA